MIPFGESGLSEDQGLGLTDPARSGPVPDSDFHKVEQRNPPANPAVPMKCRAEDSRPSASSQALAERVLARYGRNAETEKARNEDAKGTVPLEGAPRPIGMPVPVIVPEPRVMPFEPDRRRRAEARLASVECSVHGTTVWTVTDRGDSWCSACFPGVGGPRR